MFCKQSIGSVYLLNILTINNSYINQHLAQLFHPSPVADYTQHRSVDNGVLFYLDERKCEKRTGYDNATYLKYGHNEKNVTSAVYIYTNEYEKK